MFLTCFFSSTDKPGPPESFRPTEITENAVTLKWAEPNNTGGCDITNYHLEQKNGGARVRWQKVRDYEVSTTSDNRASTW